MRKSRPAGLGKPCSVMYNSGDMWEKVVYYTTSDPSLTGCVAEVRVQSDVSG